MPFVIIAIIVALAGGTGAVYASQDALPGDALYVVKAVAEQAELTLPASAEAKADKYVAFAEKRIGELERVEDGTAIANLADKYAAEIAGAVEQIAQARSRGQDVRAMLERLQASVTRHGDRLQQILDRSPRVPLDRLDRAHAAAQNGLQRETELGTEAASARDDKPEKGPRDRIAATLTLSGTSSITETNWYSHTLGVISAITGTLGITLTNTLSDVVGLDNDPLVFGQSFRGLAAKLRAIAGSLSKSHPAVARNQLDAFLRQLNAALRSGHVSQDNYDLLYGQYSALVTAFEGTPLSPGAAKADGHTTGDDDAAAAESSVGKAAKDKVGPPASLPGQSRR